MLLEKLLFSALLLVGGVTVGLSSIVAYFQFRLAWTGTKDDGHLWQGLTKCGIALSAGVLVIRLVQVGQATVTWAGWMYLWGTAVMLVGLAGQCAILIQDLAKREFPNPKEGEA